MPDTPPTPTRVAILGARAEHTNHEIAVGGWCAIRPARRARCVDATDDRPWTRLDGERAAAGSPVAGRREPARAAAWVARPPYP